LGRPETETADTNQQIRGHSCMSVHTSQRITCNFSHISFNFQHRTFSKCNMNYIGESIHAQHRPRQNSVFVGSSTTMVTLPMNPPRKTKSAMDIQTMVLAESNPGPSDISLPMRAICTNDSRLPSCSRMESIHVSNV
jgi:hypothetical protein